MSKTTIPGRLSPQQLADADRALAEARVAADILTEGFNALRETHELTAAIMQLADTLDTQFDIRQTELIAAVLIAGSVRTAAPAFTARDRRTGPGLAAEGRSPDADRADAPTPRTPEQVNSIWGRNAVEVPDDEIQAAHEALWRSMGDGTRADAQRTLNSLTGNHDGPVSQA